MIFHLYILLIFSSPCSSPDFLSEANALKLEVPSNRCGSAKKR